MPIMPVFSQCFIFFKASSNISFGFSQLSKVRNWICVIALMSHGWKNEVNNTNVAPCHLLVWDQADPLLQGTSGDIHETEMQHFFVADEKLKVDGSRIRMLSPLEKGFENSKQSIHL